MSAPTTQDVRGDWPPPDFQPYTIPIDNNTLISTWPYSSLPYTTPTFTSGFYGQNLKVQDCTYEEPSSYSGPASSPRNSEGDAYGGSILAATGDKNQCHCGKVCSNPSYLKRHEKSHIKSLSCLFPGCARTFPIGKDLTRHMRTHRKGEGYQCMVGGCRKTKAGHVFSRKDNFDRHMRTAHPEVREK